MIGLFQTAEFWVLVSFSIFLFFAFKPAAKKLIALLDDYAHRVKQDLDEARSLKTDAKKLLSEYQIQYREAVDEADDIIAHAKQEAERMKAQALKDLKEKIDRQEQQVIERIQHAKEKALAEVKEMSVDIAITASTKILNDVLQGEEGDKLLDDQIKILPSKLN